MMQLDHMLNFARAYRDLGWAVQEQMDAIVANERDMFELDEQGELNASAVEMIRELVQDYSDRFDDAEELLERIDEWLEQRS